MLRIRRRRIDPDKPVEQQQDTEEIVLRSNNPRRNPFLFRHFIEASNWNDFTRKVEDLFSEDLGSSSAESLESFQLRQVKDILMWARHLVGNREFNRGDARAIEEMLKSITWYAIAEAEEYRETYRKMRGKKISAKRLEFYHEMTKLLDEQVEESGERNVTYASKVMKKKYRWTESTRKNFAESYRRWSSRPMAKRGISSPSP